MNHWLSICYLNDIEHVESTIKHHKDFYSTVDWVVNENQFADLSTQLVLVHVWRSVYKHITLYCNSMKRSNILNSFRNWSHRGLYSNLMYQVHTGFGFFKLVCQWRMYGQMFSGYPGHWNLFTNRHFSGNERSPDLWALTCRVSITDCVYKFSVSGRLWVMQHCPVNNNLGAVTVGSRKYNATKIMKDFRVAVGICETATNLSEHHKAEKNWQIINFNFNYHAPFLQYGT